MHISIIEDETILAEKMRNKLMHQWYFVNIFTSYSQFMTFGTSDSQLYVIDIWLGDWSGFDIIDWLRKKKNSLAPIIITSGYGDTDKIVHWLKIGADDYMVKPCIPDEFVARVEALARRNASKSLIPNTFKNFIYKNITFVPHVQEITQGQEKIFLSRREMRIFELFIRNPKSIISREDIIKQWWEIYDTSIISDSLLNTTLSRIRKKFWDTIIIRSIYSAGYILE